jgi:hypothetical protein
MEAILLLTWLPLGQSVSNHHIVFSSMQACQSARVEILKERDRLFAAEAESYRRAQASAKPGVIYNAKPIPDISAICLSR